MMYNPKFSFAIGYDPADPSHMETVKGKSATIPNQGVDITQLMARANAGLPLNVAPGVPLDDVDDTFDSYPDYYAEPTEEFELLHETMLKLESYVEGLQAMKSEQKSDEEPKADTVDQVEDLPA